MLVTEDKCCDTVCGGYTCGKGWQADPLKARHNPPGGWYYVNVAYLYIGMIEVWGIVYFFG